MSVVLLTGNHPRHQYVAHTLHAAGVLSGIVIEQRELFSPTAPAGLEPSLTQLFNRHFTERDQAEKRHLEVPVSDFHDIPTLTVTSAELNTDTVHKFLGDIKARLLLSYGVHKLSAETLSSTHARYKWNIHGGLSPWYRGCITHFWPSYMLEPQMTGFTIHELTDKLDHGPVIHQTGTELVPGDGLHDLSCRAVRKLSEDLPELVAMTERETIEGTPHKTSGRLWLARDWRPEHLCMIYEKYENRIVDMCISGEISGREPELIRRW